MEQRRERLDFLLKQGYSFLRESKVYQDFVELSSLSRSWIEQCEKVFDPQNTSGSIVRWKELEALKSRYMKLYVHMDDDLVAKLLALYERVALWRQKVRDCLSPLSRELRITVRSQSKLRKLISVNVADNSKSLQEIKDDMQKLLAEGTECRLSKIMTGPLELAFSLLKRYSDFISTQFPAPRILGTLGGDPNDKHDGKNPNKIEATFGQLETILADVLRLGQVREQNLGWSSLAS